MQQLRGFIGQTWVLLFSVGLLVLGNGLQGTLLGVRAGIEGMGDHLVGFMMSAYFLGYLAGSLCSPRMVVQVGHIRTFAALTSIVSAISLLHILVVTPVSWIALRGFHGGCYAGLVLVIESWLNGSTESKYRGRVLSLYGIVVLLALSASQPLLNLAKPSGFELFLIVSVLLSLALVPVTLSRVSAPSVVAASRLKIVRLYTVSPIGTAGVFVTGFTISAFTGMGPLFAQSIGFASAGISTFMAMAFFGALILQWPLGWLSDLFDRRKVIVGASLSASLLCLVVAFNLKQPAWQMFTLALLFGGLSIPTYSLCIANTNDRIAENELIPAASSLLLVFGAGSIIGPLGAGFLMSHVGAGGLFLWIGAMQFLFIIFGLYHIPLRPPVPPAQKEKYVYLPRTTHVILQMDERGSGELSGQAPASE